MAAKTNRPVLKLTQDEAKSIAKQLIIVASEAASQTERLTSKTANELVDVASGVAIEATNKLSDEATIAADKLTSKAVEQLRVAAEEAAKTIRIEASAERKRMEEDMRSMMTDVRQKIMSAGALNGSFEKLLGQVDVIEESQVKLVKSVDLIHEAIYDPDAGIFARINNVKISLGQENAKLEKELDATIAWRKSSEENGKIHIEEYKVLTGTVGMLDGSVKSLVKSRTIFYSIAKWTAATVGGGAIVLLFKFLYDFISRLHVG